jgi:hypothetical protein
MPNTHMQNPGVQAGASRNQLGGWLHSPSTASDWQEQILAFRFGLNLWLAQNVAALCFGEVSYD